MVSGSQLSWCFALVSQSHVFYTIATPRLCKQILWLEFAATKFFLKDLPCMESRPWTWFYFMDVELGLPCSELIALAGDCTKGLEGCPLADHSPSRWQPRFFSSPARWIKNIKNGGSFGEELLPPKRKKCGDLFWRPQQSQVNEEGTAWTLRIHSNWSVIRLHCLICQAFPICGVWCIRKKAISHWNYSLLDVPAYHSDKLISISLWFFAFDLSWGSTTKWRGCCGDCRRPGHVCFCLNEIVYVGAFAFCIYFSRCFLTEKRSCLIGCSLGLYRDNLLIWIDSWHCIAGSYFSWKRMCHLCRVLRRYVVALAGGFYPKPCNFALRYAMPVVRLRECGHMFHGACVGCKGHVLKSKTVWR